MEHYSQQKQKRSPRVQHLNNLFDAATFAQRADYTYKKECEEFFYADVEGTFTEFTKSKLIEIQDKYNVPISTKIAFPIIENLAAQLTGTQPYPRLVGANQDGSEFAKNYEQAHAAVAYESNQTQELKKAIDDWLITGSGYMITQKADYYDDSTFNVVNRHIYWRNMFIDPETRRLDLSDAQFACIAYLLPKKKAEDMYDISISPEKAGDIYDLVARHSVDDDRIKHFFVHNHHNHSKKDFTQYVLTREFYEQKVKRVYIASENGYITNKKPELTKRPNPEYEAAKTQLQQLQEQIKIYAEQGQTDTIPQLQQAIQSLTQQMGQLPKQIEQYAFIRKGKEPAYANDFKMIRKNVIIRTLLINDYILEEEELYELQTLPVVHIASIFNVQAFRTYGMVHYMKDLIKAMNKLLANTLLNFALHGNRKLFVRDDTIIDKEKLEKDWAKPGVIIEYRGEPNDGAAVPQPMDAPPIPQVVQYLIDQLRFMIEYTTGINSLMQGMPNNAPDTLGGTQSLLAFGSQRIKSYSRALEPALKKLAYNTVAYLKMYAPKDKMVMYIDDNNQAQEVILPDGTYDLQFKVRVEMQKSMPTHKAMAGQLLSMVASQTQDPAIANVLIEYMLKNLDLLDADKMLEDIAAVRRLQEQVTQMEQQLKQSDGKIKSLENNLAQARISNNVEKATVNAEKDIELAKQEMMPQEEPQEEEMLIEDIFGESDGL